MQALDDDDAQSAPRSEPRRALLLLNRKARSGSQPVDAALGVLVRGGLAVEEVSCTSAADMGRVIRTRGPGLHCVIVGGGDGTLNGVASALVETRLPLGILPLGTANDLARTLGIGPNLAQAAQTIVDGAVRDIDLGEVNGHLYFNVASIGFSAELARELTAKAKRRWGTLGYAFASARLLARTRPFTAFIEHDGATERVKTVQISVGNGRHYGGGLTVDQSAEPDDGKLHVYSLEVGHWSRLLALAPAMRRGTHGAQDDVRTFATSAVTIRTRRSRSVNTDGELTTATPAVFRLIPKAVRVFAPPPPRSQAA
ncbi:lipid kinase [Enterovirga sp.]|uniref:lipid kinase n=1 Tax=Enterovirga sp. TaxID=2026350 RepID=UPI0026382505|nr:lipid kinase [Enterovirga sp.]MDB5589787.1 Lipid kinase [Enterovirga sp.]